MNRRDREERVLQKRRAQKSLRREVKDTLHEIEVDPVSVEDYSFETYHIGWEDKISQRID